MLLKKTFCFLKAFVIVGGFLSCFFHTTHSLACENSDIWEIAENNLLGSDAVRKEECASLQRAKSKPIVNTKILHASKNEGLCIGKTVTSKEFWSYDQRKKVSNYNSFPYNAAFLIQSFCDKEAKESALYGTGFMIGKGIALTAAHNLFRIGLLKCVYFQNRPFTTEILEPFFCKEVVCYFRSKRIKRSDATSKSETKEIKPVPVARDTRKIIGFCLSSSYPQSAESDLDQCHDYAVLFFEDDTYKNVSNTIKRSDDTSGISVLAPKKIDPEQEKEITVFGFPVKVAHKKSSGDYKGKKKLGFMYEDTQKSFLIPETYKNTEGNICATCGDKVLLHKTLTTVGQSGSPMVHIEKIDDLERESDIKATCHGIHTGSCTIEGKEYNRGIAFTENFLSKIKLMTQIFKETKDRVKTRTNDFYLSIDSERETMVVLLQKENEYVHQKV